MIAIIAKPDADEFAKSVLRLIPDAGGDELTAKRLGIKAVKEPEKVIVLGGDGTVLLAERIYPGAPKLVIGCGRVSFMSEIGAPQIKQGISKFLRGEYSTAEKTKISCSRGEALNEIAVLTKQAGRMVELRVSINGVEAENFRGDGIVVATQNGSTAYALSAGGPVLDPGADAFAIVPVSPFRLSSRPIVVSSSAEIRITAKSDAVISIDGFTAGELNEGQSLDIKCAKGKAKFITFGESNCYRKLRELP